MECGCRGSWGSLSGLTNAFALATFLVKLIWRIDDIVSLDLLPNRSTIRSLPSSDMSSWYWLWTMSFHAKKDDFLSRDKNKADMVALISTALTERGCHVIQSPGMRTLISLRPLSNIPVFAPQRWLARTEIPNPAATLFQNRQWGHLFPFWRQQAVKRTQSVKH